MSEKKRRNAGQIRFFNQKQQDNLLIIKNTKEEFWMGQERS